MQLSGVAPLIRASELDADMQSATEVITTQLAEWGFMAVEVPGINKKVEQLLGSFASACASNSPKLSDYVYTSVPQISSCGNHGFYPFYSEVPRLAQGIADPKEFIHVSGAMLNDRPLGASQVLDAFPAFRNAASEVFDIAFRLISLFGNIVCTTMPKGTPEFNLSRDATNLRVIHYNNIDGREVIAHEHSGIQMLGLQLPPSDQGLQYVLHDGTWVEPVIAKTDIVLCNIGRMLTSASGGKIRPSTHRVHCLNTQPGYERWSSVLFAYPPHEAQQWAIANETFTKFDSTWGDFIRNRVVGLQVPSP
jgi:hypothetical protein